ncbi:MAG: DUF6088 family protein [Lachnospiraceae bacterium]|nr:DUF6088 family protein [Lachnospiraceae bacterium]
MEKLLEYLKTVYKDGEPIFLSDIKIEGVSYDTLKHQIKELCDRDKLKRFDKGIYYLPKKTILKSGFHLSPDEVADYKYISRFKNVMGYYSGLTFANAIGVTTQVPVKQEIVTNETTALVKDIKIKNLKYKVRKSKTHIDKDNVQILQLLDFIKDMDYLCDEENENNYVYISDYIKKIKVKRKDVDKYISLFPTRIYKNIYEMRLDNVFA